MIRVVPIAFTRAAGWIRALALPCVLALASAQDARVPSPSAPSKAPRWGEWIERDFPFYSALVYAQQPASQILSDNITPRGLVLNLGANVWACFDLDLLRIAAVWEGEETKTRSSAAFSYQGEWPSQSERARRPPLAASTIWFANGRYPGWQLGPEPSLIDPRQPSPLPGELPRGPVAPEQGRFSAVRFAPRDGVRLEYKIGDAKVTETIRRLDFTDRRGIERRIRIAGTPRPLVLVLAARASTKPGWNLALAPGERSVPSVELIENPDVWAVRVPPHAEPVEFIATMIGPQRGTNAAALDATRVLQDFRSPAPRRWTDEPITRGVLAKETAAYVVDDVPLPLENPWRRNVRLADIQFFADGTAAAVTFDGDVWLVRGLEGDLSAVRWQRFTSGLHEPLSLAIRDGKIFVLDRNGLWRLRDADGNGEADAHEMFANAFGQTLTINEYSNTLKLAPDGSFVIAKKGFQDSTRGELYGAVVRISADGRDSTLLGWGFRQPFIGVDPATGLITASDQEGNYVPATPLYVVDGGTYHGFLAPPAPKEQYPAAIAEPMVWIPRTASASGVTQVWLRDARMGPLRDALLHVSYNPAALFLVRLNDRHPKPQAAVINLIPQFEFSPIGAAVNPRDGQLYLAGFKIYGSAAQRVSGLARVRYTNRPSLLPREVVPMREGVLLRFEIELDPAEATALANYTVARWNYRRTAAYGSPHYQLDGSKGQDRMLPSSAYLSSDRRSVFIGLPDMRSDVMQMQIDWRLTSVDGARVENTAYLTPSALATLAPEREGFGPLKVDLVPRTLEPTATAPSAGASAAEGRRLATTIGCIACHAENGLSQQGPAWRGLQEGRRILADGSTVVVDAAYLRESILDPAAKVIPGFESPMPSYAGIVNETQIESLVLYLQSLR